MNKRYEAYSSVLDAVKCQRFARALADDNHHYYEGDLKVPPMLLAVESLQGILQILQDPEVLAQAGDLARMLHAEESVIWHQCVPQGETVEIESILVSIEDKGSGNLLELKANVLNDKDSLVAEVVTTLFFRHPKPGKMDRSRNAKPIDLTQAKCVEDWLVPENQTQLYAEASGDYNPIHLDENFAKAVGLDGRILHGMCTLSYAQRSLLRHFANNDPEQMIAFYGQFSRPVYLGDTLTCRGMPEPQAPSFAFDVLNQHGKAVIKNGTLRLKSD